jgi:tRNA(adenine34) deaminase
MGLFAPLMELALGEAVRAASRGETPVGSVLTAWDGAILARAGNRMRELVDPTAHAEILTIRAACGLLRNERLTGCTLYVTLEPCPMCAAAIGAARIGRLVYGASDPKSGGLEQGPCIFDHPQSHHKPEVIGGVREAECAALLRNFFSTKR